MFLTRTITCALAVALAFGFAGAAGAMPEMAAQNADARFEGMDKDKDGKLSKEEFFGAMPQMKEGAFTSIDKDGDGYITLEEWRGFSVGHGKDGKPAQGAGMGGMGGMQMPPRDGASAPAGEAGDKPAPAPNPPATRDLPQQGDGVPGKKPGNPPALIMPEDPAGK